MEEFLHLKTCATYPAQSFVVLIAKTLAASFLLLVSACLPRPLHATSFSLTLPRLAIAEVVQVTVP